jgi:PIN domain nuclease of toxin-antitoxin system
VICYLDTQVTIWLRQKRRDRLSRKSTEALEGSELPLSPAAVLELASRLGLRLCNHSFPAVVEAALFETWTRDPFDRMIVAHARSNGYSPLATSDARIREHYPNAIW